jgi:APA family basic amino acid/polyamine antiporter
MALFKIYHHTRTGIARFNTTVLRKVVGLGALYSTGYGDVGSSIYYALGITTIYAGGASFLAIGAAGLFFIATVLSYAELSSAIPEGGGSSLFAQRAFGDGWAFFTGWALLLDYILTLAISAFSVGPYLGYFFPIFKTNPQVNVTFTGLLILALVLMNIVGLKESSWFSLMLAGFDVITQVSLMAMGAFFLFNFHTIWSQFTLGSAPTWHNFLYGISIAMVAYTGIEAISQMAGEAKNAETLVPRAMFMTMGTTILLYSGISLVALSAMKPEVLSTTWVNDPIAGIANAMPAVSHFMGPWVAVLGATILTVAANAGLIGVSRLAYSMSNNLLISPIFHKTSARYKTPMVSIAIFGTLAALIVAFFPYLDVLADLYNYGAMLSFSMTHLALIRLRKKEPELKRPFRVPLAVKISGWEIPLPTVFGFAGTFGVFLMVLLFHKYGRIFGTVWMAGGIAYYLWFRRKESLPVMERVKITEVANDMPEPKPHKHILVATSPTRPSPMLRDVLKVAKADNAKITVISVLEIPLALPLDAPLEDEEAVARHTLDLCQAIGMEEDVLVDTILARGRGIGPVLNMQIRRLGADTVVLNDTGSSLAAAVLAAIRRSANTVMIWTFQIYSGAGLTPTPRSRLSGEAPIIRSTPAGGGVHEPSGGSPAPGSL